MRKAFALFVILVVCCIAGAFPVGRYLLSEKDRIQYEEHVILGDKAVAEGITVTLGSKMNSQHFWDTTYVIGAQPEVESSYRYYGERHYERATGYYGNGVNFGSFPNFGSSGGSIDSIGESTGFGAAYRALEEETKAGETRHRTVPISEYFTYYPIWLEIETYSFDYTYSDAFWGGATERIPKEERNAVSRAFAEFFKVPIMEGEVYTITVTKDAKGTVSELHGEPGGDGTDSFHWWMETVWDDEYIYFTFRPYSGGGKEMNTDLIPGGFGIYRLPYSLGEDGIYHVRAEELTTIIPLEKEVMKREAYLELNAEGDIVMATEDENFVFFTVYDRTSWEAKQSLKIERSSAEDLRIAHFADDFVVCTLGAEQLIVLDWNAERGYELKFIVPIAEKSLLWQAVQSYRSERNYDWNGEQLVIATYGTAGYDENGFWMRVYDADFSVAIYDATGEIYLAEYLSSQYTGIERKNMARYFSGYRCENDAAIEIQWRK